MWLDLDNADYLRHTLGFAGCQIALRVDRDVTAEDGRVLVCESRYFLTSLDPARVRADELLAHVRRHWEIENCLFFLKDRWWDEDRHWTRRPGVADWLAQLNTAATTVLRLLYDSTLPLRARADFIQWSPHLGLQLLRSA